MPDSSPIAFGSHATCRLAEQCGLTPFALVMLTLFDVIPPNERLKTKMSGSYRVFKAAREVGILEHVGFQSEEAEELLRTGWRGTPAQQERLSQFLTYRGRPNNSRSPIYVRTKEEIPWSPDDLLPKRLQETFQEKFKLLAWDKSEKIEE
jgi:hypothetical protein